FFYAICLSNIPRHPNLPLFPYTTLFRSHRRSTSHVLGTMCDFLPQETRQFAGIAFHADVDDRHINPKVAAQNVNRRSPGKEIEEDRKSTRLNSSHQIISYAVFCLKKKKK